MPVAAKGRSQGKPIRKKDSMESKHTRSHRMLKHPNVKKSSATKGMNKTSGRYKGVGV